MPTWVLSARPSPESALQLISWGVLELRVLNEDPVERFRDLRSIRLGDESLRLVIDKTPEALLMPVELRLVGASVNDPAPVGFPAMAQEPPDLARG